MAQQRTLAVDDDSNVTDFLRCGLSYEGFAVEVVNSGKAGLDVARDRPPDVVILDIMMPGMKIDSPGLNVDRTRFRVKRRLKHGCTLHQFARAEVIDFRTAEHFA